MQGSLSLFKALYMACVRQICLLRLESSWLALYAGSGSKSKERNLKHWPDGKPYLPRPCRYIEVKTGLQTLLQMVGGSVLGCTSSRQRFWLKTMAGGNGCGCVRTGQSGWQGHWCFQTTIPSPLFPLPEHLSITPVGVCVKRVLHHSRRGTRSSGESYNVTQAQPVLL